MGSRLPYRGLQNCASLLAGGTGTVIGIGTPVGRDVEVDRAVAVRLGSGGGGVVAVGIVLSVAVGEETGVGVAVGREVEAGTGAWPSVGDGVGDSFAVATAVGGSPGVGGRIQHSGPDRCRRGVGHRSGGKRPGWLTRERDSGGRGAGSPPPAAANARATDTSRKTTDATRSSRSFIVCALEAFEIPGERPAEPIHGRGWWRRSGHPDMTDVLTPAGLP